MPRKTKFAAALMALLLCGCSDNTAPPAPEVTSGQESAVPTVEAPYSTASEQGQAPGGIPAEPDVTEAPGGVDLVSGEYSDNSLIFDLNGTYCDVSELPFTVETFKPEIPLENLSLMNIREGKLILCCWDSEYRSAGDNWSIFTCDIKTGALTEVLNAQDILPEEYDSLPVYADDSYAVVHSYGADDEADHRVFRYGEKLPKLKLPESEGDNVYFSNYGMTIVYDQLYFSGNCRLSGFDISVPVIYRAYLTTGLTEVYGAHMEFPQYGVGNVCYSLRLPGINSHAKTYLSSIRGEIYDRWNGNTETVLERTYYPVSLSVQENEILGSKTGISWTDREKNTHMTGTTGFGYLAESAHVTREGLFLLPLVHNGSPETRYLLTGMYDTAADSSRAALIPCSDGIVFAENSALYYVNAETLETTMICPNDEVFLYVRDQEHAD